MNEHEWRHTPPKVSFVFQNWQRIKTNERLRSKPIIQLFLSFLCNFTLISSMLSFISKEEFWFQSQYAIPHCWCKRIREHTFDLCRLLMCLPAWKVVLEWIIKTSLAALAVFFIFIPFSHFQYHLKRTNSILIFFWMLMLIWYEAIGLNFPWWSSEMLL